MSDDMGDKFKQIADLLGQSSNTNIPENVKGILNMLVSNSNSKADDDPSDDTNEESSQNSRSKDSAANDNNSDMEDMARKMKKAIGMINPESDPRSNLLNAIRPYLNKNRQKKLQTCMKLMKIGSLTRILEESE